MVMRKDLPIDIGSGVCDERGGQRESHTSWLHLNAPSMWRSRVTPDARATSS